MNALRFSTVEGVNEGLRLILRLNIREDLFSGSLKKCFHQGERKNRNRLD